MKRQVTLYIEGEKVELFNDEKIGVNSSVQNIADISKVFTDFSQSFTVPASVNNNIIFQHFYNNEFNSSVNFNLRRDALIEIDLTFFRRGKVQLEKSNLKNGKVESYTITFYGEIRALKDRFGEDLLDVLDYSAYTHDYTGAEVQARIEDGTTDYDVRYPLISSERLWQYNEPTTPLDNIDTTDGAINYTELFPALKVSSIFEAIQNQYEITFEGLFLEEKRFTSAYLYLKNKETAGFFSQGYEVDFLSDTATPQQQEYNEIDLINNTLRIYDIPVQQYAGQGLPLPYRVEFIMSNVSTFIVEYYIDVYVNGAIYTTVTGFGNQTYTALEVNGNSNVDYTINFVVRTSGLPLQYTPIVRAYYVIGLPDGTSVPLQLVQINCGTQISDTYLDLNSYMPEMKVSEFFSGVLKLFNLTCYPIDVNTFEIETLEDWYNKGYIYDITKYTTVENIDVERIKLYKSIEFKHAESSSFMNNQFTNIFNRNYGDMLYSFPYDGEEYKIEVPFENLMFNKFDGINLQVGYCLTNSPDFKPYVPKPIIIYQYEELTTSAFYLNNGITIDSVTSYVPFGQDVLDQSINYTLNFGQELSTLLLTEIPNSIYRVYYSDYLLNLFNPKNRLTRVVCVFPISILTNIRLNDRVIIRDKRYIINDMKTELTSGEVTLELINDFRPIKKTGGVYVAPPTNNGSDVPIAIPIIKPNLVETIEWDITGTGVTGTTPSSPVTNDTRVTFFLPENTNTKFRFTEETGEAYIMTEDSKVLISERWKDAFYVVPVTYTYQNGDTETENLVIIQPA